MMILELKERAKLLPFHKKLWMYPTAYLLVAAARGVVWMVDKFNALTFRELIKA